MLGLLGAILLGLLAARISQRRWVGLIVFITTLLTPWLFEISRLVFEVSILPALLSGFLLLLYVASRREQWTWDTAVGLGALLGLMVYSYSIGRILAPLFALGLVFFLTRRRWRGWFLPGHLCSCLAAGALLSETPARSASDISLSLTSNPRHERRLQLVS